MGLEEFLALDTAIKLRIFTERPQSLVGELYK